ncbi:hypothetical protein Tco_1378230 [Tanacetum coccineum]
MTTLTEHIIVVGAENRPPMLEKSMYDSWASRIRLFIKGNKNGRMMLNSIDEGPLVYPTVVGEDGFASVLGEALYEYYRRFSQLINDMHTIRMTMQQVQVNTKFLNAIPSEWSKFVTDVKYPDPLALVANSQTLYNPSQSLQHSVPSMHPPPQQFTLVYAATNHQQPHHTLEKIRLTSLTKQWHSYQLWHQGFHLQTINSECFPIPEIRKPFKTKESQFNKFKEDKLRVLLAMEIEELLQPQGEIMQLTEDLDAYDSDCDDISSAKAVLMVNLSSCDSEVLFEVPYSYTYPNDMINQDV